MDEKIKISKLKIQSHYKTICVLLFFYSLVNFTVDYQSKLINDWYFIYLRIIPLVITTFALSFSYFNFEKFSNAKIQYGLFISLILVNIVSSFFFVEQLLFNLFYSFIIVLVAIIFLKTDSTFNYYLVLISSLGFGTVYFLNNTLVGQNTQEILISLYLIVLLTTASYNKLKDNTNAQTDDTLTNKSEFDEYKEIFENSADGIFQIDQDFKFKLANLSLAKTFGFESLEDLYQLQDITNLFKNIDEFEQLQKLLSTHQRIKNYRMVIKKVDGSEIIVRLNGRVVRDKKGDLAYYEGNLQDISHLVKKEIESVRALKKLREEKVKANDEIDQVKKTSDFKTQFLTNMSHEIRTPMNSVLGFLTLIENALYEDEAELKDFAGSARQSAESLLDIINNILDISKIEAGKMELDEKEFHLSEEVDKVVSMMTPTAREKKLELLMEIKKDVPDLIVGDNTRYRQILVNLISNAIKNTEKGYIKIEIDLIDYDGKKIRTRVKDTGKGIAKEKMDMLFQPYIQIKNNNEEKRTGTGLGLVICREFTRLMGGEINVISEVGQGSVFSFTVNFKFVIDELPQEEVEIITQEEETENLIEEIKENTEGSIFNKGRPVVSYRSKKRLLLVEDNPISQKVELRILREVGYSIDPVSTGLDAIEAVQSGNFDLVLMDVEMAEMDGITATKKIRELPGKEGKIPIIAVTANSSMKDREKCLASGMDDYVAKPININFLKMIIDRWLNEER